MQNPDLTEEITQAKNRFGIVGNAPALIAAVSRAIQVAPIDLSVLITGESGTGKEFFPKIIHAFSPRKHAKYIAVNCGAIPEGTIDSELFGHEKGAFTGAIGTRKGYFEETDGGTIFLDEVAELPLTTQARLLRVLETGEFIKVGSSVVQKTNIRIVAATNVDMPKAVEEGRFREDLYYRLSTVNISIPPLRDRGSDIALLARKFAADFAERYRMPQITLDESARSMLMRYRWPGNVRQLKNAIEQMALFDAGQTIDGSMAESYLPAGATVYTPAISTHRNTHTYDADREILFSMIFRMQKEIDALRERLSETPSSAIPLAGMPTATPAGTDTAQEGITRSLVRFTQPQQHNITTPYEDLTPVAADTHASAATATSRPMTLEDTERETIRRTLEANLGRRKDTARQLNISERTLYRKIKEYGLE